MVISQNVQMWLIVIVAVVFCIGAIVFWLWEHIIRLFQEIQKDTGKKYSKKQWVLIWFFGLLIVIFIIIAWVKWGVNLS